MYAQYNDVQYTSTVYAVYVHTEVPTSILQF